jgi:hypothetical protein
MRLTENQRKAIRNAYRVLSFRCGVLLFDAVWKVKLVSDALKKHRDHNNLRSSIKFYFLLNQGKRTLGKAHTKWKSIIKMYVRE